MEEADVLLISGLWQNGLLDRAQKLRFIQAIGTGTDQLSQKELAKRSVRLASARGVNVRAVAEHAMALILALSRRLPEARDNQAKHVWRGMIGDPFRREDELGGKTLLVFGLGQIGGRLAHLAKTFEMRVVGLRRNPVAGRGAADAVRGMGEPKSPLPEADFVALTCPLTSETENLVNAEALGRMKPSAYLGNVARGRVVDEAALVEALAARRIAGAGIDVTTEEPLAARSHFLANGACAHYPSYGRRNSPLWGQCDEILRDNLGRLWRGEERLRNQVAWSLSASAQPPSLPERPDRAMRRADRRRNPPALAPHLAEPDGDVDPGSGAGGVPIVGGERARARDAGKQTEKSIRQKARSRREDVATTMAVLLRSIKAPRLHEMKVFPRTRHRHVEQPALLVDLLGFAGGHVGRDAAVHEIENKDYVPFLSLGGMNGRQDQIVFVE